MILKGNIGKENIRIRKLILLRTFLEFELPFQRHQFFLNPISVERVMVKILTHLQPTKFQRILIYTIFKLLSNQFFFFLINKF